LFRALGKGETGGDERREWLESAVAFPGQTGVRYEG